MGSTLYKIWPSQSLIKSNFAYLLVLIVLISSSCESTKVDSQEATTIEPIKELVAEPIEPTEPITDDVKLMIETGIRVLPYKGGDLGYLGEKYYGNKAYRNVLSAYNDFEDNRSVDKKHDTIEIPELANLSKSEKFPKLGTIAEELSEVIEARNLFVNQEEELWELPKSSGDRNFREVKQTQKQEILAAAIRMHECVAGLEEQEDPPKKAIGQFKQVAYNLRDISEGKIDENGYALDMVHQRTAHGFANCIRWAKEE